MRPLSDRQVRCFVNHVTKAGAFQVRYAAMDSIVIIMMLDECLRRFPVRFQRYWDNMLLTPYARDFLYRNYNPECKKRWQPDLPVPLESDDDTYQ